MKYRDAAMDNPLNWSFRIGRLFAVTIRVHITFLLGAVILLAMELPERGSDASVDWGFALTATLGGYVLLFFIVLVHEFGHCFGARYTGGEADEILIWPLGGLAFVKPPNNPSAHMITTLAGPMVNVVFCAISSVALVAWTGSLGGVPWNPLHPATPVDSAIYPTMGQWWLMRFFGISYVLLIINMFPVFPFDGGRVLQAWLWPRKGYRVSMELATGTGMVGAVIIGVFGLLSGEFLLIAIAGFGYLSCWQIRRQLREFGAVEDDGGLDFGSGYSFGDERDEAERKPGFFARRRTKKAELRLERERAEQKGRERMLEEALRQISVGGMDSLTPKQRRLLEEETHRKQSTIAGDDEGIR